MRVSSSFYKEVNDSSTTDEWVEIVITKERAKVLKKQGTPIPIGTVITVRVIKATLSTVETETMLTDQTSYEESKVLYLKRWGIETRFDELKHQFEIGNFSGETPVVIEQDFYVTILLSNMASLIEQDAQAKMQEKNASKELNYNEYKSNHNILVGKLKTRLIETLLEENSEKKDAIFRRLFVDLERNIVPVVGGRSYNREIKNKLTNTASRNAIAYSKPRRPSI